MAPEIGVEFTKQIKDALARPLGLVLDGPEHGAGLGLVGAATIGVPSAVNCARRCGPKNMLAVPYGYSWTRTVAFLHQKAFAGVDQSSAVQGS